MERENLSAVQWWHQYWGFVVIVLRMSGTWVVR